MATDRNPERAQGGLSSLDRGLRVLTFVQDRGQVDVAEIAAGLDIPLSTAYRYVQRLKRSGFLVEVGDRLLPGERLTDRSSDHPDHLVDVARPMLVRLREATGLTAALSVRVHGAALCLASRRSGTGSVAFHPGQVHTLYSGASATPLLAMAPAAVRRQVIEGRLHRYTAATPDAAQLRRELELIRRQGYHVTRGWLTPGMSAVGVPVVVGGRCLCALSLVAADNALADPAVPLRLLPLLRQAAGELAARLPRDLPAAWVPPDAVSEGTDEQQDPASE
ncbi:MULTISPECIES: IclR family transcriptional regulator [unclassified Streptomyces]|uniref:IclR family transcriptional regulator n=1 Tax=unclassified Streptomyces TaxID=2593676 RepID=UPI002E22FEB8|nr:helix-turn-helix domain-containing protein [Streptomyces sp. NBC_01023]